MTTTPDHAGQNGLSPALPERKAIKLWSGMRSLARSSLLTRNIIANVVGRAWIMIMSFVFVPVYIHLLGIEAYGVIGLYASLMILFSILDFGLSVTLNRELSRMSMIESQHGKMRDLVRTLEIFYWAIAACIGISTVLAAPYLARHWLHPAHISVSTLELTIRLIGVTAALQWPTGLYGGGLAGLQQFVRSNIIDIVVSTLRGVGGVATIFLVSRSLEAYFIWQIFATWIGLLMMQRLMWRSLPRHATRARFDFSIIKGLWHFSAGMTFISLLAIIAAQSDKLILSNIVPLALYAKYVLATAVATASNLLLMMVVPAIFPLLSQSLVSMTSEDFHNLYRRLSQLITLSVVPITMTVSAFSYEIIAFWTHDADLARTAAPFASILTFGAAFTGLFQGPYLLQLSNGSTRISVIANVVNAVAVVPLVYFSGKMFGPAGAASSVVFLALMQLFVVGAFIQHKFLPGSYWRWLINDIALPWATAAITAFGLHAVIPLGLTPIVAFVLAGLVAAFSLLLTTLCLPSIRLIVFRYLAEKLNRNT